MVGRTQREHWAKARHEMGLVPASPGFARHGLAAGLDELGVLVSVLPSDPLACDVEFTDEMLDGVLPKAFTGAMRAAVSALSGPYRAADIAYRESRAEQVRRAYVGIRRDGGAEGAVGSTAFWTGNAGARRYKLWVLVHLVRTVVEAQRRFVATDGAANGPHELVIVFDGAAGAQLGGYADGWSDPSRLDEDEIPACFAASVVMRIDVDEWPTGDGATEQLLIRAATHISDTFNDRYRRFLVAPERPGAGSLDRQYA